MIKNIYILILIISSTVVYSQSSFNVERDWGTYFGDNKFSLQNSQIDNEGNLYIVGYVFGDVTEEFNYFNNAPHQNNYAGGSTDGFIAKFNPQGDLIWATLFGGENTDIIERVTIDKTNNVYIMGFTDSETGIATSNAHQDQKHGYTNMFISKFDSNGNIERSTFYGNEGADSNYDLLPFALDDYVNNATILYMTV